jgi:hypothetical protein
MEPCVIEGTEKRVLSALDEFHVLERLNLVFLEEIAKLVRLEELADFGSPCVGVLEVEFCGLETHGRDKWRLRLNLVPSKRGVVSHEAERREMRRIQGPQFARERLSLATGLGQLIFAGEIE